MHDVLSSLEQAKKSGSKKFAVLIDPDQSKTQMLDRVIDLGNQAHVDYWLVGGSLIVEDVLGDVLARLKSRSDIPVVLFPGSTMQVHALADAILLLSLISGRNPDLLIGSHVQAAPLIHSAGLEVVPTGYMIIDGGVETAVSYMSNTRPIPRSKHEIAQCTAMAGEMLGLKTIYMDAGSGAHYAISAEMISRVASHVDVPLIVGGGIRDAQSAQQAITAGADMIVVGTAIEQSPEVLMDISAVVHAFARHSLVD